MCLCPVIMIFVPQQILQLFTPLLLSSCELKPDNLFVCLDLFPGMPLAQAISILQKHCRIIKNVQVLYSEQVRMCCYYYFL